VIDVYSTYFQDLKVEDEEDGWVLISGKVKEIWQQ
jgi:hypothetical protein